VPEVPPADLIGRDELVEWLRAGASVLRLTMVSGVAGIGKSSVIRAVAAAAMDDGAVVGWGTCVEGGSVAGYWPWTQALDHLVRTVGRDAALGAAGEDASLLAPLVPSLGTGTTTAATDRDRLVLWDAVGRFLESLAGERAVTVVIDDLQWADES
jgi:predicted ATPase